MPIRIVCLAMSMACLVAFKASAQTLSVGDPAPPITVSKWVKGDKIDKLEPGKTYVVEFWATWCGPCRASIPHLTQLQKKYKDQGIAFMGVSVWEREPEKVEPFVKEMGDKMDYNVALDDTPEDAKNHAGKMAVAWMEAAGEDGIPTAFIVKDEKIAWIGHPMSMDEPLAKVVAGTWDLAAAASKRREDKTMERKFMAVLPKIVKHLRANENKEALAAAEQAITDDPILEARLGLIKYNLLSQEDDAEAAAAYGNRLVDDVFKKDAGTLNAIAWFIVNPDRKVELAKRDLKLAMKAAERANDLKQGEDWQILDTLAKVCFDSGDLPRALKLQERSVKLSEGQNEEVKERLEQYRKAAEEKKP